MKVLIADTVIAGGKLTSFARHEPGAVQAARRAYRLGRRTRLEWWARVPVPKVYAGPKRRTGGGARQGALQRGAAGWPARSRSALGRPAS